MKNTKDHKVRKKPEYLNDILDDMIEDETSVSLYVGLKNRYMLNLIRNTPYKSTLAFAVCESIENGTPLEPIIADKFPYGRRKYNEKMKAYQKALVPLKKEIKELNAQRNELEVRLEETVEENRRIELTEQLTQTQMQLIDLSDARDNLKEPTYRTIYNSERAIFTRRKGRSARRKADVVLEKDWDILRDYYQGEVNKIDVGQEEKFFGNMQVLRDAMGLNDSQIELLKFMIVHERCDDLEMFVDNMSGEKQAMYNGLMSKMTGVPYDLVKRYVDSDSMMAQYGLIEVDAEDGAVPVVSGFVRDLIFDPAATPDDIKARLAGRVMTTELDWQSDFGHMGAYGRDLERLIRHSIEVKRQGNTEPGPVIWFTGEPDTGKTSAAIALVQHLAKDNPGLEIRLIGEKITHAHDEQSGLTNVQKLTPEDRMSQIMLSVAVTQGNPNIIYLIEEPESFMPRNHDYMGSEGGEGPVERVIVQRLFEQNPATALIFTTNHANEIHPAVRRRGIELEFDMPGRDQRQQIIQRVLERNQLHLPEQEAKLLARTYAVPAGKWASAIKYAGMTVDDPNNAEELSIKIAVWIERQAERDHGSVAHIKPAHVYRGDYDMSLVNMPYAKTGMDADNFLRGMKNAAISGQGFELLLEGWPGTGKTEMGWMLADRLDKEVIYVQRSDILNMFVGGSEANLAKMFRRAADRKAILMIDEVETLVPVRDGKNQNHENSLVAEFLSQMDGFKEKGGMLIVTTNHASMIDPAVAARFDDRMRFDFLKPEQAEYAWNKFFGMAPPDGIRDSLKKMTRLTPRDFVRVALVARRTDMIEKPDLLLAALQQREKEKPQNQQSHVRKSNNRMGFITDDPPPANNNGQQNGDGPDAPLPPIVVAPAGTMMGVAGRLGDWRVKRTEGGSGLNRQFDTI